MSERERGRTRLSTESPPPPPLHHSLLLARGSECGTGHPTLFPLPHSRPPPADPLLRMNSFIFFPPFVIFMSTSLCFIIIILFLSFSAPLFSFLSSPTHRYPTHFVTAKEKKMIGRQGSKAKEERRYEESFVRTWSSKTQEAGPLLMDYPERRTQNAREKRATLKT